MKRGRVGLPGAIALALVTIGISGPAAAVAAPAAARQAEVGDPRLNGFWNIDEGARFDTLAKTKAELTPAAQAIAERGRAAQEARTARGEVVSVGSATCALQSVPFVIGVSEPFMLIVKDDIVVQYFERYQITTRYYYMDGRTLEGVDKLPPSNNGYSVAHWEGKTLVIETRGLPRGGIQGGGMKGPKSVLIERVSLSADGDRLEWNYYWTDPDFLAKPLSYSIMYDRAPKHIYAMRESCDPNENPSKTVEPVAQPGEAK